MKIRLSNPTRKGYLRAYIDYDPQYRSDFFMSLYLDRTRLSREIVYLSLKDAIDAFCAKAKEFETELQNPLDKQQ